MGYTHCLVSTPYRTQSHNTTRHKIKMKWQYAILAFALFAASSAETYEEEEGDPRLGYIAVGSDGTTSITFNATSIQNAVILGLSSLSLERSSFPCSVFPWDPCLVATVATLDTVMDLTRQLTTKDSSHPLMPTTLSPRDQQKCWDQSWRL